MDWGIYSYKQTFYTGKITQPDTLSIFVKPANNRKFSTSHLDASANVLGKTPIFSSFTCFGRIWNAVKNIFKELFQIKFKMEDPHLL